MRIHHVIISIVMLLLSFDADADFNNLKLGIFRVFGKCTNIRIPWDARPINCSDQMILLLIGNGRATYQFNSPLGQFNIEFSGHDTATITKDDGTDMQFIDRVTIAGEGERLLTDRHEFLVSGLCSMKHIDIDGFSVETHCSAELRGQKFLIIFLSDGKMRRM